MGMAFIPLYVKYLGVEAYGLIGIFSLLQACLSLLDLGLTPTLSREMARFTGGAIDINKIRSLLRSIEFVAILIACVIIIIVFCASNYLSVHWVKSQKITVFEISRAFIIMGVVIALRFIEGLYRSSLIGLQKQVLFNLIISFFSTLRWLGAVAVMIWISPTIQYFFIWQAITSIATLVTLAYFTYNSIPKSKYTTKFSSEALSEIWIFARGMLGITALTIILAQVDKIILSKVLLLSEYGYYSLAATLAGAITMLVSPVAQAYYPKAIELISKNENDKLILLFHKTSQFVTVLMGSVGMVFVFFSKTILLLWTHDSMIAEKGFKIFSILSIGNLLNGFMWIPYQTQLAYGWTSLSIKLNIFALIFIIPALFLVTPVYGSFGAAFIWVLLNFGYVLIGVQFMFFKILKTEKLKWYTNDLLIPLVVSGIIAFLMSNFIFFFQTSFLKLIFILTTCIISLSCSFMFATILKSLLFPKRIKQ